MTALATAAQLAPRFSLDDMYGMASAIAESRLFGIQTPQQAYALMLIADAEGLHPASVAQDYDVIQGRPARKTHSVLARYQQAGGSVQWHDFTEEVVSGTFSHPKGGSVKIEWTIAMAAKAGLASKDNWKKTPRAMLRARCIAEGVRATFPAALGGAIVTEEAQDFEVIMDQPDGSQVATPKAQRKPKPAPAPAADPAPGPDDGGSAGGQAEDPAAVTDATIVRETTRPAAAAPTPAPAPASAPAAASAAAGEALVGAGEIAYLKNKARALVVDLDAVLADAGGLVLDKLTKADFQAVKARLVSME